jgi:hypothetical protein
MTKIKIFLFPIAGLIIGLILSTFAEISKFSHINLVPFRNKSWALWSYPLVFFISFLILAFLFKIKIEMMALSISFVIIFIIFFLIFEGSLFVNPAPFGL